MKIKTLIQASAAVDAATQHILLHVTAEGKLFASGTDNKVKAIVGEIELYEKIKTCMKNNFNRENIGYANTHELAYNLLACSGNIFICFHLYL